MRFGGTAVDPAATSRGSDSNAGSAMEMPTALRKFRRSRFIDERAWLDIVQQ
jgi:hypothetical protein